MSDRIYQLRIFIQIAETGSFVGAARALKIPPATVSAAIRMLESELGIRLLHRTTRQVDLTHDGQRVLPMARKITGDLDEMYHLLKSDEQRTTGRLHIGVPNRIVWHLIAPTLPLFLQKHPELELRFSHYNQGFEPLDDGVDAVLHVGTLHNDSLVHKPLGMLERVNCASPGYLAANTVPNHPDELAHHWAVGYLPAPGADPSDWSLTDTSGAALSIPMRHRVAVSDTDSHLACCQAGLGLIQALRLDVEPLLAQGTLVEVLPQWPATPLPVAALYPHRHQQSRRLAAFLHWFEALLQKAMA